jgi:hypothetical protein
MVWTVQHACVSIDGAVWLVSVVVHGCVFVGRSCGGCRGVAAVGVSLGLDLLCACEETLLQLVGLFK